MKRLGLLTFLLLLVTAAVLAGCGGSSSPSSSAAATSATGATTSSGSASSAASGGAAASALSLAADPSGQFKYNKSSLSAKAGKVTITFTNSSPVAHNVTIQQGTGASGNIVGATPTFQGGSKTVSVTLKPGTYTFYCSVPGHRMAGMHGVLTVS